MNSGESVAPVGGEEGRAPPQPAILAVDDHPPNLLAYEAILTPLGVAVMTATSGEDAIRLLLGHDFALILLDVQMPGMSGLELAALIRSHARLVSVPIIFITAISADAAQIVAGYARGAVDYLLKPFAPEILQAKVSVFVELYRKQQKIREQAELLHQHELREVERRNEERFRRLADSMPLPVWEVRPDGQVSACNDAWTDYSGLSAEQTGVLINPKWMHPLDIEDVRAKWAASTSAGQAFDVECRLRKGSDDTYRWHILRAVPERGQRARAGCWIVTAVDVDAQKMVDDERAHLLQREQKARQEAESANRMKDEFLATVSHELRTPLNAILGWARMIRKGTVDSTRLAKAMETIERNAQLQAKLVSDILDVSRIVTGKLLLQLGPVDLSVVVNDAVETVKPAADAKSVELRWAAPLGPTMTTGDASRLQQVVWNLVSNAVKFTPSGGRIDIRLERIHDRASIVVEDTGVGIRQDFLPYAFERFRQGDGTTSRKHEGLGLGLAIVKHIVDLHDGGATAESGGPGQGARFTVTLPLELDVTQVVVAGASASRTGFGACPGVDRVPLLTGANVLYVDDQPDARELVDAILTYHGATVVSVGTAQEALCVVRESAPHLLISDIGLPDEDGYALIRSVRALGPARGGNVPAIALTAYVRPEDGRRAKEEGFQAHLAKPVEEDELVRLVASLLAISGGRRDVGVGVSDRTMWR